MATSRGNWTPSGWRRAWFVAAALWAIICVIGLVVLSGADFFGPFLGMRIRSAIIAWLIPSGLLYGLGWVLERALRRRP